jgi:hypothetical protein
MSCLTDSGRFSIQIISSPNSSDFSFSLSHEGEDPNIKDALILELILLGFKPDVEDNVLQFESINHFTDKNETIARLTIAMLKIGQKLGYTANENEIYSSVPMCFRLLLESSNLNIKPFTLENYCIFFSMSK